MNTYENPRSAHVDILPKHPGNFGAIVHPLDPSPKVAPVFVIVTPPSVVNSKYFVTSLVLTINVQSIVNVVISIVETIGRV